MSDTTDTTNTQQTAETNGGEGSGFTPPESQEALNKLIESRLSRERAKYADYDDKSKKAEEFDKLSEQNKTEIQKLLERAEAAEKLAAERETALTQKEQAILRKDVAREHGVPESSLVGSTAEELEKSAKDLVAWRDSVVTKPKTPKRAPTSPFNAGDTANVTARQRAVAALRGE